MSAKINDGLSPQQRYEKKTLVQFVFRLNRKTDADLLELLDRVENRQGFLKKILREYIANHPEETPE